jgi:hypothetical protein
VEGFDGGPILDKYSDNQPRDDHGRWTAAGSELAGDVVNICTASGISRFTDDYGNKSFNVEYECRDGSIIRLNGQLNNYVGFIIDPNG